MAMTNGASFWREICFARLGRFKKKKERDKIPASKNSNRKSVDELDMKGDVRGEDAFVYS